MTWWLGFSALCQLLALGIHIYQHNWLQASVNVPLAVAITWLTVSHARSERELQRMRAMDALEYDP